MSKLTWSYGITTHVSRFDDLLPRTLASLANSGFEEPRLFVDGATSVPASLQGLPATFHMPALRPFGNWYTAAIELTIRAPEADRYAIFQDDMVTGLHLREYLEQTEYPETGYQNLYLWNCNSHADREGWYLSDQMGKGGVALVFSNKAMRTLLGTRYMADRSLDPRRGHRALDGGIVSALKKERWQEWVHKPSLVDHVGDKSAMGNSKHPKTKDFMGEDFDYLTLLK